MAERCTCIWGICHRTRFPQFESDPVPQNFTAHSMPKLFGHSRPWSFHLTFYLNGVSNASRSRDREIYPLVLPIFWMTSINVNITYPPIVECLGNIGKSKKTIRKQMEKESGLPKTSSFIVPSFVLLRRTSIIRSNRKRTMNTEGSIAKKQVRKLYRRRNDSETPASRTTTLSHITCCFQPLLKWTPNR